MRTIGFFLLFCFLSAAAPAATNELSAAWIDSQLDHVKTVEGFLGRFTPKSLERNLLIYASQSRQFASFDSPRAVVYSFDGDFIFAFNGEPGSEGYHEVEILEFDHDRSRFVPEVIRFDPKGIARPKFDRKPQECFSCHQTDARPNWDPYFHWVGFYGSEDDNVNAGSEYEEGILRQGREYAELQKFLAKKQKQIETKAGRYRFLPKHPNARPNNDFDDRVTCLNMKRMLRAFTEHPKAAALWKYWSPKSKHFVREAIPESLLKETRHSFAELEVGSRQTMKRAIQRRLRRHSKVTGEEPQGRARDLLTKEIADRYFHEHESAVEWRYVFEELLGVPFRPYSLSFTYDYSLNLGGTVDINTLITDATLDEKTGRIVLSRVPQTRPRQPYGGFVCSRSKSYFDLPLQDKKN